ncbi:hypothetical protein Taro_002769 [Colocasia esculenta]|uniref:Uncharacterized protein n=1 Tax=Colocasia esculenta TaxID=4460 RepID=A0A843TPQ6_COLES|nr:hypothetical protein [Colocasia esculenta]
MTDQTSEEVNAEFFQEDFVEDVELTTHTGEDESEAPIYLSKGNEIEEVDPHEIKGSSGRRTDIECEGSDKEEEYTNMVHGARSGSTSVRRSSRGRGLFAAPGSGEFTPPPLRVTAAGPSSLLPPVAVGVYI